MIATPSNKERIGNGLPRTSYPPLPIGKHNSRPLFQEDARTVGTTVSPTSSQSEFSFQTPSSKSSSPGRYAWSTPPRNKDDEKKELATNGNLDAPHALLDATRYPSPTWRHSPAKVSRNYSTPSRTQRSTLPLRKSNSTANSLKHTSVKLKKTQSIMDLTDSEDEDDSVIEDSSLRQLIRVTSHTLSQEGRVLEEEALIEWQRSDLDQEDDGITREWRQLPNKEDRCNSEISFAMDKVAYGHISTTEWLGSRQRNRHGHQVPDDNRNEKDDFGSFADRLLGMCICCTDRSKRV